MSFPRYPEYKDSGVEWLREVPASWNLYPVKRGFTRKKELNSGMRCENRLSLTMRGVVPRDLDDLDGLQASEFETYQIFCENDLAFKLIDLQNIKTSRVGLVPETGIMSSAYIRLEPNRRRISPGFAYWFFTDLYNRQIFNQLGGGVRQTLGPEELVTLPFPFVSLRDQAFIATFLDRETAKIDALVAEQERLIALLKEKRQVVISHAVTKGLDPDAPMKDSGIEWLGEVPAHWDCAPMKYLVRLQSGGTPSKERRDYWDGEIPWASAKDMKVDRLSDTEDHVTDFAVENDAANLIPVGAVIVVVRGMILARTFPVALVMREMAINQDLKAVLCGQRLHPEFLAWYLRGTSDESLCRLDEAGHGTKALRMDVWTSLEFALPPLDEQAAIVEFIDDETKRFDSLVSEASRAMALLVERRSALISAAVTGKIDVRGIKADRKAA